jgi:hypothetical protein
MEFLFELSQNLLKQTKKNKFVGRRQMRCKKLEKKKIWIAIEQISVQTNSWPLDFFKCGNELRITLTS